MSGRTGWRNQLLARPIHGPVQMQCVSRSQVGKLTEQFPGEAVDPIVVASQIVLGLQTIASRHWM